MIKLNKRVISLITSTFLISTLFQGIVTKEVEADSQYVPSAPELSMGSDRTLNITDKTDWTKTHSDKKIVDLNNYTTESKSDYFKKASFGNIISYSIGDDHYGLVNDEGELYLWGSNNYGQLGNGQATSSTTQNKISSVDGKKIKAVACGDCFTIVLTVDGSLYSCGYNKDGQLGDLTRTDHYTLQKVELPDGIVITDVCCDARTVLALDEDGDVFSWGGGLYGQLGNGRCGTFSFKVSGLVGDIYEVSPTEITFPGEEKIKKISMNCGSCAALTEEGEVYSWGLNASGETGFPVDGTAMKDVRSRPAKLNNSTGLKVTDISIANGVGTIMEDGSVYLFKRGSADKITFPGSNKAVAIAHDTDNIVDSAGNYFYHTSSYQKYPLGSKASKLIDSSKGCVISEDNKVYYISGKTPADGLNGVSPSGSPSIDIHFTVPEGVVLSNINYSLKSAENNYYDLSNASSATLISSDGSTKDLKNNSSYSIPSGSYELKISKMAGNNTSNKWILKSFTADSTTTTLNQSLSKIEYSLNGGDFATYNDSGKPKLPRWETSVIARVYNTAGRYSESTKTFNAGVTQEQCTPAKPTLTQSEGKVTITDNTDWSAKDTYGNLYQSKSKVEYSTDDSTWQDYKGPISVDGLKGKTIHARVTNTYGLSNENSLPVSCYTVNGSDMYLTPGELLDKVEDLAKKAESTFEPEDVSNCLNLANNLDSADTRKIYADRMNAVTSQNDEWSSEGSLKISDFQYNPSNNTLKDCVDYLNTIKCKSLATKLKGDLDDAINDVITDRTSVDSEKTLSKDEVKYFMETLSNEDDKDSNASKFVDLFKQTYLDEDGEKALTAISTLSDDDPYKDTLTQEVNNVKTLINSWETTCKSKVDNLTDNPSYDGIMQFNSYLNSLPDSSVKDKYQISLNDIIMSFLETELTKEGTTLTQEQVDNLKGLLVDDDYYTVINTVVRTPFTKVINKDLINHAISIIEDPTYRNRYQQLYNNFLDKAEADRLVSVAESTYEQDDIDSAHNYINSHVGEFDATDLVNRLTALQDKLTKWMRDGTQYIQDFIDNPSKSSLDVATSFINTIPDCSTKDALKSKLDSAISQEVTNYCNGDSTIPRDNIIDFLKAYSNSNNLPSIVKKLVDKAVASYEEDDVDLASNAINLLDENSQKESLKSELKVVSDALSKYKSDFAKLKSDYESSPSVAKVKPMVTFVDGMHECSLKNDYSKIVQGYLRDLLKNQKDLSEEDRMYLMSNLSNDSGLQSVEDLARKAETTYEPADVTACLDKIKTLTNEDVKASFYDRMTAVNNQYNAWVKGFNDKLKVFTDDPTKTNLSNVVDYLKDVKCKSIVTTAKDSLDNAIVNALNHYNDPNTSEELSNSELSYFINNITSVDKQTEAATYYVNAYKVSYSDDDYSRAEEVVKGLPDSNPNKSKLLKELEDAKKVSDDWTKNYASKLGELDENLTFDGIKALVDYINTTPNENDKAKFLDDARKFASMYLVNALDNSELNLTNSQIDYLKSLIPDDLYKSPLFKSIDGITSKCSSKDLFDYAISKESDSTTKSVLQTECNDKFACLATEGLVSKAEKTYEQSDVDVATKSANSISDSSLKDPYLNRLKKVTDALSKWDKEGNALIDSFVKDPSYVKAQAVINYISVIPDCSKKTELVNKFNNAINQFVKDYLNGKYPNINVDDVKKIIDYVSDDSAKSKLNSDLDEYVKSISEINEVAKKFEELQKNPTVDSLRDFYDYLTKISNQDVKNEYLSKISKIAYDLLNAGLKDSSLKEDDISFLVSLLSQEDLVNLIKSLLSSDGIKDYDKNGISFIIEQVNDESMRNTLMDDYMKILKGNPVPVITDVKSNANTVNVSWKTPYKEGKSVVSYSIAIVKGDEEPKWFKVSPKSNSYSFTALDPDCNYKVLIRADFEDGGSSEIEQEVNTSSDVPSKPDVVTDEPVSDEPVATGTATATPTKSTTQANGVGLEGNTVPTKSNAGTISSNASNQGANASKTGSVAKTSDSSKTFVYFSVLCLLTLSVMFVANRKKKEQK